MYGSWGPGDLASGLFLCPWLTASAGEINSYELANVHTMGLEPQTIRAGKTEKGRDLPRPHNDSGTELGTEATLLVAPTTLPLFNKHCIAFTTGQTLF